MFAPPRSGQQKQNRLMTSAYFFNPVYFTGQPGKRKMTISQKAGQSKVKRAGKPMYAKFLPAVLIGIR